MQRKRNGPFLEQFLCEIAHDMHMFQVFTVWLTSPESVSKVCKERKNIFKMNTEVGMLLPKKELIQVE